MTLAQLERFEGEVAAATLVCRSTFACSQQARVEVVGWPHEYDLFMLAANTRVALFFRRKTSRAPELNHEWGNPIVVALSPDGTGRQDAALEAVLGQARHPDLGPGYHPDDSPFNGWPRRQRVPLANIRVTVHREDVAEQSR